jgi:hypothetical protein
MSRRIIILILAVVDLALLIMIVSSSGVSAEKKSDTVNTQYDAAQVAVSSDLSVADQSEPEQEEAMSFDSEDKQYSEEMYVDSEETSSSEEASAVSQVDSSEKETPSPAETDVQSAQSSESDTHTDNRSFDTSEYPTLEDFLWITPEIIAGTCPEGSENMDFPEALGGWKCYIWDDAGVERLANMKFSGTEDKIRLTFDWFYTHVGDTDEGYEDNSPDSVYEGALEGAVVAYGAGMVRLTDFYRMDDHQYAFGSISWPDGISGHLMLVRP